MNKFESLPSVKVSEDQVASMFNGIASRYDFLNRLLSAGRDQKWRLDLVRCLPKPATAGALLDVATGTGDVLDHVARRRPEYRELVGTDIAVNMLEIARAKLAAHAGDPTRTVELELMSAETLRFPDRRFHALSIAFGLRNVVRRDQALAEFSRVLKPGGVLAVLDFFHPRPGIIGRSFWFYFRHILPRIGALFSQKSAYTYLPESVANFFTEEQLRERAALVGFRHRESKVYLFGWCRLVVYERP